MRSLISPGTEVAGLLGQWPGGTQYPTVPGYAAIFEVSVVGVEASRRIPESQRLRDSLLLNPPARVDAALVVLNAPGLDIGHFHRPAQRR